MSAKHKYVVVLTLEFPVAATKRGIKAAVELALYDLDIVNTVPGHPHVSVLHTRTTRARVRSVDVD